MSAERSGLFLVRYRLSRFPRLIVLLVLSLSCAIAPFAIASEPKVPTLEQKWSSAISNDRVDLLQSMLEQHINDNKKPISLLKQVAPNGKSALMVASKQGDMAFTKRLVQLGASVNELTITGGTPLMFAVLGNHIALAEWLHKAGANIDAKGSNGWSAATIAGAKGQSDMLRWLIEAGADMDSPDVYRFTPLMRAVDNQHTKSVEILLANAKASANSKDESENTPLHFAVANRQKNVVQLLLDYGADPLAENRDGITPAELAKQAPELSVLFAH